MSPHEKAKAKALAPKGMTAADALAVLWHTLSKVAPKRAPHDLLVAGAEYSIAHCKIEATVGRFEVSDELSGRLCVGEEQQRAQTTACDQVELLANIAGTLTKPHRERLFASVLETYKDDGTLPAVHRAIVAECKALIDQLRDSKTVPVRGNVRFCGDEEHE